MYKKENSPVYKGFNRKLAINTLKEVKEIMGKPFQVLGVSWSYASYYTQPPIRANGMIIYDELVGKSPSQITFTFGSDGKVTEDILNMLQ